MIVDQHLEWHKTTAYLETPPFRIRPPILINITGANNSAKYSGSGSYYVSSEKQERRLFQDNQKSVKITFTNQIIHHYTLKS